VPQRRAVRRVSGVPLVDPTATLAHHGRVHYELGPTVDKSAAIIADIGRFLVEIGRSLDEIAATSVEMARLLDETAVILVETSRPRGETAAIPDESRSEAGATQAGPAASKAQAELCLSLGASCGVLAGFSWEGSQAWRTRSR
jgi:hypothetical protein